ncbi:MAG: DnaJ domain-containing protein [Chlorobiales bacterium]|nr:DnaJ domain-containing protein [Chlorobiales bacterium]
MAETNFVDYYSILKVGPKATAEEIKRAYMEQIKEVHPDRLQSLPEAVQEEAARKSQLLNQAKELLLDDEKREVYDISYRHYMSEAIARAAQQGFGGGNYNDYMQGAEEILRQREVYLSANRSKTRIFIIIAIVVMGILSAIWRFFSPSDIAKMTLPKETVLRETPAKTIKASGPVRAITLVSNGSELVVGDENGNISVWPIGQDTSLPIKSIAIGAPVLATATDGEWLAVGTGVGDIKLLTLSDGKVQKTLEGHRASISDLEFSPDGKTLASSGLDNTIQIWEMPEGKLARSLLGVAFPIYSIAFVENGTRIAFADDRIAIAWNWSDNTRKQLTMQGQKILAVDALGKWVAIGGLDNTLKQVHLGNGTIRECTLETSAITAICYNPGGDVVVSGSEDGNIRIYGAESGRKLKAIGAHNGRITRVIFSPDGSKIISASLDGTVKVWPFSLDSF